MKTKTYLWSYLVQFFLEWEIFQTQIVDKIKTHILRSVTISPPQKKKSWHLWENVEKYFTAGQATDDNMALHARYIRLQTHLRIYNTYSFPSETMAAWTRLDVTLHEYWLSS
jgi:hypothetical protein